MGPEKIRASDDDEIRGSFLGLLNANGIFPAYLTGLKSRGILDESSHLLPKGVDILRHMANAYDLVELNN